jgi:hypothetical protein
LDGLKLTSTDPATRAVVVDWLIDVVNEFGLPSDTLFHAVSLLDRHLARQVVLAVTLV